MAKLISLSPLKFYDDLAKQSHRKSYAFGHIAPLIVNAGSFPSFQFVIPEQYYEDGISLEHAFLIDADSDNQISDITQDLMESGFSIIQEEDFNIVLYQGALPLPNTREGQFYLKLEIGDYTYYSEVFCLTNSTDDCLEIEYWNKADNFYLKDGIVAFPDGFHFKLLLKSEIGKPEYNFEEESTKRLGYTFIESQVSKKTYRFNTVIPEFICDAMRIIRLCDNKIIRSKGEEYDAMTFEMEVEWQTQGDLASVTCEFETDNIITNFGGFVKRDAGGDYNDDFNNDFNNGG